MPVHRARMDVLTPAGLTAVDRQRVEPLADGGARGLADLEDRVVPAEVRDPQGLDAVEVDLRVLVVMEQHHEIVGGLGVPLELTPQPDLRLAPLRGHQGARGTRGSEAALALGPGGRVEPRGLPARGGRARRVAPDVVPDRPPGELEGRGPSPLHVLQPDVGAALLEGSLAPEPAGAGQDDLTVEEQARSVVHRRAELVLVRARHREPALEDQAERVGPRGRREVEQAHVGALLLVPQAVELGQLVPGVAIEPVAQVGQGGRAVVLAVEQGEELPLGFVDAPVMVADGLLVGLAAALEGGLLLGRQDRHLAAAARLVRQPLEEGHEGVVVGLVDGVALVIVAARAAQGRGQEGLAGRAHDVVEHVIPGLDAALGRLVVPLTEAQEARGHEGVGIVRPQLVPRQLHAHELVVGQVLVQSPHDPVPVAPDVGLVAVALEPVGLRIAHEVQPVPSPPLAVLRPREEVLHQPLVGVGGVVGDERLDLAGGRGQARQVVGHPADQGAPVGLGCRTQAGGLEARQDEAIHGGPGPGGVLDGGRLGVGEGRVGPALHAVPLGDALGRLTRRLLDRHSLRPRNPPLDPAPKDLALGLRKRPGGRHLVVLVLVADLAQQERGERVDQVHRGA